MEFAALLLRGDQDSGHQGVVLGKGIFPHLFAAAGVYPEAAAAGGTADAEQVWMDGQYARDPFAVRSFQQ